MALLSSNLTWLPLRVGSNCSRLFLNLIILLLTAALEIWRRQVGLELPRLLLPCLLLHCQETKVTSTTSKSWQIVKKVWALLAGLELTGQQLILGLSSPVPTDQASSSPLLDREAQSPLFPGLARPQWAALVQFASRAVNQVRTGRF